MVMQWDMWTNNTWFDMIWVCLKTWYPIKWPFQREKMVIHATRYGGTRNMERCSQDLRTNYLWNSQRCRWEMMIKHRYQPNSCRTGTHMWRFWNSAWWPSWFSEPSKWWWITLLIPFIACAHGFSSQSYCRSYCYWWVIPKMSPAESSTDAFSSVLPEPTCASEPLHLYVRFGYASPRHQTSPQWVENPKWDANGTGMLDILEMESIHHGRQPLLFLFKFKVPKTMLRLLRRMMQNATTRSILCRKVIEDFIVTLSHRLCCVGGKCQPCMHGLSSGVKFVLDEPSLGPNHFHTPEIYLNMINMVFEAHKKGCGGPLDPGCLHKKWGETGPWAANFKECNNSQIMGRYVKRVGVARLCKYTCLCNMR